MFNVVGHDGPMLPQQADNCSRFDGAEALRWVEELKGALQDGQVRSTSPSRFAAGDPQGLVPCSSVT